MAEWPAGGSGNAEGFPYKLSLEFSFINEQINEYNKYFLSTFYVPGPGHTAMSKTDMAPAFM